MTATNPTPSERVTPDIAAAILRQHNAWRRDVSDDDDGTDAELKMLDPKLIGEAIDVAVAFIEREYETTEQAV